MVEDGEHHVVLVRKGCVEAFEGVETEYSLRKGHREE